MNMQQMMKQAQKLQKDMEQAQAKVEAQEFEATAGGVVKVRAKGTKEILEITVNEELLNKEDKAELEELLVLAVNNVINDIEKEVAEKMSAFTSGLNLPF